MKLKSIVIILLLTFSTLGTIAYFAGVKSSTQNGQIKNVIISQTPTPKKDEPFRSYTPPLIEKKRVYTIVMIGDSMTNALGPHGGPFSEKINQLYKPTGHEVIVDNYASSATNILSLEKVITTKTKSWDVTFEPLLLRKFDLLLIESFGYNPLSQYGLEGGIKKQNEELSKLMKIIISTHPKSAIAFVATISPNRANYARTFNPNTPASERTEQAEERISYIKNHIEYAKAHDIPLINIFEKSLTSTGDGNLEYINPDDYIHPSAVGLEFIAEEAANFIYETQILPR